MIEHPFNPEDDAARRAYLEKAMVEVAINAIAFYGMDLATYHFPYLADHYLEKIAREYPAEVEEKTREVREWRRHNTPQIETIDDDTI